MRYNGWRENSARKGGLRNEHDPFLGSTVTLGYTPKEKPELVKAIKPLKYRNVLCEADGIKFKSKLERQRYLDLRALEHAKLISDVQVHPKFAIDWPNGKAGRPTKICDVELDFAYYDNVRKKRIFEDSKGRDNPMSRLKRKLVQAAYLIEVELVKR